VLRSARAKGASDLSVPADIRVVDSIPLLGSGKTDYVAATAMAKELATVATEPDVAEPDAAGEELAERDVA
jgi:acyl-[acyl-carrier-protein]-phospholipid O-acyltransferase/long-chain-fatty-acid--[acyl-carrier-protein] ligase